MALIPEQKDYRRNDGHQSLGAVMFIACWVVVLGFGFLWFNKWFEQQYNPNQNPTSTTAAGESVVTLDRNRAGHYVTNGQINNQQVTFLLDTGATNLSIPAPVAYRLQLRPQGSVQTKTANGIITVYKTKLDKVQIGDITLGNVRANINPHMEGDEILLGMSFLKRIEFSQRGSQLTLRQ